MATNRRSCSIVRDYVLENYGMLELNVANALQEDKESDRLKSLALPSRHGQQTIEPLTKLYFPHDR